MDVETHEKTRSVAPSATETIPGGIHFLTDGERNIFEVIPIGDNHGYARDAFSPKNIPDKNDYRHLKEFKQHLELLHGTIIKALVERQS